jgi:hypothetical protein
MSSKFLVLKVIELMEILPGGMKALWQVVGVLASC